MTGFEVFKRHSKNGFSTEIQKQISEFNCGRNLSNNVGNFLFFSGLLASGITNPNLWHSEMSQQQWLGTVAMALSILFKMQVITWIDSTGVDRSKMITEINNADAKFIGHEFTAFPFRLDSVYSNDEKQFRFPKVLIKQKCYKAMLP